MLFSLEIFWKKWQHPLNPSIPETNERMLVKLLRVVFARFLSLVLNASYLMQFCKYAAAFFL